MDFNALDLLASTAVLQTRDSDNSSSPGTNHQDGKSDETSEQSAETDEDGNPPELAIKDISQVEDTMGSMKRGRKSSLSEETPNLPKDVTLTNLCFVKSTEDLLNCGNKIGDTVNNVSDQSKMDDTSILTTPSLNITDKTENSDTDSCMEDNDILNSEESTSDLMVTRTASDELDNNKLCKNKTIMRSLLTGQTVNTDSEQFDETNVVCCKKVNCDEQSPDSVSVLGIDQSSNENNSASIGISISEQCEHNLEDTVNNELVDVGQAKFTVSEKMCESKDVMSTLDDSSVLKNHLENCKNSLQDSVLDSIEDPVASHSDSEALHFVVVSDHCYASVPGKNITPSYSYLERLDGEDHESDSGIDGNSSSEEAEHRTRSLSLDSNCLHCGFPELSGRSGRLLSQGSDFDRSPIGNSGYHLGLSVLSPTLSSSDSQCSDYHNTGTNLVENASLQKYDSDSVFDEKKYKTVDFDLDNRVTASTSDKTDTGHDVVKVGKFRIGKFASFTNIDDTESDKIYNRDSFNVSYGVSPASSVGMPASPGIPSLLQSPCGDWDRSDAGSEVLDDMDYIPTPEEPKELALMLQSNKLPNSSTVCLTVNHDHDYCFRGGSLPSSPIGFDRKSGKTEKRKYMTAARSRGTNLYLKEPKSKTVKIKNKKGLSETIEKVKNSLATSAPVSIDCDFKKPEQPVNPFLDKFNSMGRPKRRLEKEEEPEIELDSGSKLKITGKFQNDFVYFLNKTSRNRRRSSFEIANLVNSDGKIVQPAKPIDIIVPHLTDDDLEVLQTKGRAGLAMLEKFSTNPQLLDRFSATLQSQSKVCDEKNNGVNQVTTESYIDDDKIINTILSMENDNLGSPVPSEHSVSTDMDFFNNGSGGETINLMGENMTLTPDQVDLLLNAVKDVSTSEDFIESPEKIVLATSPNEDHRSFTNMQHTCDNSSTGLLDNNSMDVSDQEWTVKTDKGDNEDTDSTYSSSDIGHSSVSDIKEDSQESFELKDGDMDVHVEDVNKCVNSVIDNNVTDKSLAIDQDLNNLALANTKPGKSLLDSELNGFSNTLGTTLPDLNLPLEKSFELLGNDFRLDKPDDLFPEANMDLPPHQESNLSDYNNTPWVVTVTIYWNDLPAIMINNKPFIRLVDIHKQILPAKDTGILKKRCQLLSIHVMNCSEMQRYFLVQYGRGYNSKSTLIVSKTDACQLVGYYAYPQPRVAKSEDATVLHLSHLSQHMALLQPNVPSAHARMVRKKRSGSRTASRNTSPERKENGKSGTTSAPPSPKVLKSAPVVIPTVVSKRLRHKKINFLEMLKGDSVEKMEAQSEKALQVSVTNKKKPENGKKLNNRGKKKEEESKIVLENSSEEEGTAESEDVHEESLTSLSSTEEECETIKPKRKKSINKISPTNGKKTQSKRLGPLRVSVKGLLHFTKPSKKSAMIKNVLKGLDVVHTALEFKAGQIPISQNGTLHLDLYKKKSSLCVRCVDCLKLLSVQSFLAHQHYPEDNKTLTTVLETQTLSPKSSDSSRNMKHIWEDFQQRREKFEGCRFLKPAKAVAKAVDAAEKSSKSKKSEELSTMDVTTSIGEAVLDVGDNMATPQDIKEKCESVSLNVPLEILRPVEERLTPHVSTLNTGDKDNDITVSELLLPTVEANSKIVTCHIEETNSSLSSQITDLNTAADVFDKSGIRSSSRKRKSRQYFSFEDYSFSNKKAKMDESECKDSNV
ncbi:hypothetical protein SNE40_013250 [Patella caerulea]|uniref:C2H2-type domain-containing protein n=1 Tax=Patella caerulea TaxID=87958 RepID=A0AAN8JIY1_PATCE